MDDHKLFVGNMAARITQRDLWRFFSPYGPIDECAKFHESYAFVRFVSADDAQRARRETHGALLKGRKLKVEFAATMNKSNPAPGHPPKFVYVQPLRRTANLPFYTSPPRLSTWPCDQNVFEQGFFSGGSSTSEEFLSPDLLRLAGLEYSSNDHYNLSLSPRLNSHSDSRFFPLSTNRIAAYSTSMINQEDPSFGSMQFMPFDFTRIRLFSDVSSGFGDDSNLFID